MAAPSPAPQHGPPLDPPLVCRLLARGGGPCRGRRLLPVRWQLHRVRVPGESTPCCRGVGWERGAGPIPHGTVGMPRAGLCRHRVPVLGRCHSARGGSSKAVGWGPKWELQVEMGVGVLEVPPHSRSPLCSASRRQSHFLPLRSSSPKLSPWWCPVLPGPAGVLDWSLWGRRLPPHDLAGLCSAPQAGNVSCISPECPPGSCPSASPPDCCSCQPGGTPGRRGVRVCG